MQQALPKRASTTFTGQVIEQLSPSIVAVWDLDHQRRFLTFNVGHLQLGIGELVYCELSADEETVLSVDRASASARDIYARRMFDLT